MLSLDLVCGACKHPFHVQAENALKDEGKHCPECGSEYTRQTLRSYIRNGPLLDPRWSGPSGNTGFG